MEEKEYLKMKLRELRLEEALLEKDPSRYDELLGIREMIEEIKNEYKKLLVEEKGLKSK